MNYEQIFRDVVDAVIQDYAGFAEKESLHDPLFFYTALQAAVKGGQRTDAFPSLIDPSPEKIYMLRFVNRLFIPRKIHYPAAPPLISAHSLSAVFYFSKPDSKFYLKSTLKNQVLRIRFICINYIILKRGCQD